MSVATELYAALADVPNVEDVFDTELTDDYRLPVHDDGSPATVLVFAFGGSRPDIPICGTIAARVQTWTVTVHSTTINGCRDVSAAVIAALQPLTGTDIKSCSVESESATEVDTTVVPKEYRQSIDFSIS